MYVSTEEELMEAIDWLSDKKELALDTETTGLEWFRSDRAFSVIAGNDERQYYFDLTKLDEGIVKEVLGSFFRQERTWVLVNAKFDLHMLEKEGLPVSGEIVDLMFLDKIHNNQHMRYSLEFIAERWGFEKLSDAKEYCDEHKLKTVIVDEYLGKEKTLYHFDKLPLEIVVPYAETDVRVTFSAYKKIKQSLESKNELAPKQAESHLPVLKNESALVRVVTRMETDGVRVDTRYCKQAKEFYEHQISETEREFERITGRELSKGPTTLKEIFGNEIEKWTYTEKGNPEFDTNALKRFKNPAAKVVIEFSKLKKQLDYFNNFIWFSDKNGFIHCNYNQSGAATSRFTCSDPNLQNLTRVDKYDKKEATDDNFFPVRRAFIPRDGHRFFMLDQDQVEYRVMLDIANARGLIEKVLSGLDVHQATADISGTTRTQAKTTNFLTLYGGGVAKLADDLFDLTISLKEAKALMATTYSFPMTPEDKALVAGLSRQQKDENFALMYKAKAIQTSIFNAAPEIKNFMKLCSQTAKQRGYVFNFLGRRYSFPDRGYAYKAPNHLVQGTCADILKLAMNRISGELMRGLKSKMILQIHDELVFDVAHGEESLIPEVKKVMETIYPYKNLPLTVGVDFSEKSLADKQEYTNV